MSATDRKIFQTKKMASARVSSSMREISSMRGVIMRNNLSLLLALLPMLIALDGRFQAAGQSTRPSHKPQISQDQFVKSLPVEIERRSLDPRSSQQHFNMSLRQVLVPLFNAGHLNRMYYANKAHRLDRARYSLNNRGPNGPSVSSKAQSSSLNQLLESKIPFGERRRPRKRLVTARMDSIGPNLALDKQHSKWSQPDPRKSYSLPIAMVNLAAEASDSRQVAGPQRQTSMVTGRQQILPIRRNEFETASEASSSTAANVAAPTSTATAITTTTNRAKLSANESDSIEMANDSVAFGSAEPSDEFQYAVDLPRKQQPAQPHAKQSEQHAERQRQQPFVTLVKYVPVLMSVPSEQLTALVAKSGAKASGEMQQQQQQQQHYQQLQPVELAATSSASSLRPATMRPGAAMLAKYPLLDAPLMAPAEVVPDYSQLYPLAQSAGLQSLIADQYSLSPAQIQGARLAYIPMQANQAAGSGGLLAAGQISSKALSAYASKLIAMLRPSSLFSSIGAASHHGTFSGAQQHQPNFAAAPIQQQHPMQIIVLAPAAGESTAPGQLAPGSNKMASNQLTGGRGVAQQATATSNLPVKADETLLNQASKVHSTKSNRQASQMAPTNDHTHSSQMRLPQLAAPVNGLICIQGLFGGSKQSSPPPQQTNQRPVQQEEEPNSTFDYEPRPTKSESRMSSKSGPPIGGGGGGGQQRGKESPARIMQKIASRPQQGVKNPRPQEPEQQELTQQQVEQQRMLGSSSESRSMFDSERDSSSSNLAAPFANQPNENYQRDDGDSVPERKPIIPFTIRDKIEAPRGGGAEQRSQSARRMSQRNKARVSSTASYGPTIEYDEPAEGEPVGTGGESEQRRSRTSFVSSTGFSGPASKPMKWGSNQVNAIDYRKDPSNQREFSLPILMASSSTGGSFGSSAQHLRGPTSSERNIQTSSIVRFPPGGSSRSQPPPSPNANPHESHSPASYELMGLSSFASSVSTTTSSSADTNPMDRPGATNKTESSSLGRLISSISMSRAADLGDRHSPPSPTTQKPPSDDTIELVVNSTPRDQRTTIETTQTESTPAAIITASPLTNLQLQTIISSTTTTTTTTPAPPTSEPGGRNAFSHDRTLSQSENVDQFGSISESLQTNPLDLIDLQNSRTSFELPSQLESLEMLGQQSGQRARRRMGTSGEHAPSTFEAGGGIQA